MDGHTDVQTDFLYILQDVISFETPPKKTLLLRVTKIQPRIIRLLSPSDSGRLQISSVKLGVTAANLEDALVSL